MLEDSTHVFPEVRNNRPCVTDSFQTSASPRNVPHQNIDPHPYVCYRCFKFTQAEAKRDGLGSAMFSSPDPVFSTVQPEIWASGAPGAPDLAAVRGYANGRAQGLRSACPLAVPMLTRLEGCAVWLAHEKNKTEFRIPEGPGIWSNFNFETQGGMHHHVNVAGIKYPGFDLNAAILLTARPMATGNALLPRSELKAGMVLVSVGENFWRRCATLGTNRRESICVSLGRPWCSWLVNVASEVV